MAIYLRLAHQRELWRILLDEEGLTPSLRDRRTLHRAISLLEEVHAYIIEINAPHPRSMPYRGPTRKEYRSLKARVERLIRNGWIVDQATIEELRRELKPPSES